jgi:hypothetical protein
MYIEFNEMPAHTRLWVYQANKNWTKEDEARIGKILIGFCDTWKSHGAEVEASFELFHTRFIVLGVNEQNNKVGGCSIDSSVAAIKYIEEQVSLNLFDRTQIVYWQGDNLTSIPLAKIKEAISAGEISEDTLVFDNLIQVKEQLESSWQVKIKDTWLNKYFSLPV